VFRCPNNDQAELLQESDKGGNFISDDSHARMGMAKAVRLAAKASLVAEIAWEWFVSIF
jgi:hypothetical protein